MDLYYRIWMDCIKRISSIESNKEDWQEKSMICMTIAMAANIHLIMVILQKNIIGYYFYEINISSLSDHLNYMLTMIILYLLPFAGINYGLIFYRKRYEKFMEKYPYYNGKLFLTYVLTSISLPALFLIGGKILYSLNLI